MFELKASEGGISLNGEGTNKELLNLFANVVEIVTEALEEAGMSEAECQVWLTKMVGAAFQQRDKVKKIHTGGGMPC